MVLYYFLMAPCLYLWYSTTFYWLPAYTCGALQFSYGSLPIPMELYYLLLANCISLWYSAIFYWPRYSLTFFLAYCLSLWYSTIFNWPTAYVCGTILPSTSSLPIPMVHYYLLLAPCLSLWYSLNLLLAHFLYL